MDVKLYKRHGKWYNLRCYAVHMMKERRCELLPKRLLAGLLEKKLIPEEFGNYEPSLTEIFVERAGDQA